MKCDKDYAVHVQSSNIYSQGFNGYYKMQLNGQIKLLAFNNSEDNAYKAAQIFGLTKVAMKKEPENKYPSCVSKCMSDREKIVQDKKPLCLMHFIALKLVVD